jgi:hypothetical protein
MSNIYTAHKNEKCNRSRIVYTALLPLVFGAGCATDAQPDDTIVARVDPGVATQPGHSNARRPEHCVAPWGIDWNDVLHVNKAAIVSSFCTEIRASDPYTPEVLWITNTEDGIEGGPVLYPEGYTPRHKAPMNDFLHKLDSVRYVVQPGNQELSFRASQIEKRVTVGDLYEGAPDFTAPQLVWPATALLGELPPLPPGTYSADIHFVMSDTHCDGQTSDFAQSCLPPGDSFTLTRSFVVQP